MALGEKLLPWLILAIFAVNIISNQSRLRVPLKQHYDGFSTENRLPAEEASTTENIAIFYNLFIKSRGDWDRVKRLVNEQLANKIPRTRYNLTIHLTSIGIDPFSNTMDSFFNTSIANQTVHLGHYESGDEKLSLHALWEYCRNNNTKDAKVIYMHSKGSFNPSWENDNLRKYLSRGALSEECLGLSQTCNVCSSRMSPLPHPHTPGNMWLARCNYVKKLLDPLDFAKRMKHAYQHVDREGYPPHCFGLRRYAQEHWIHSHPSVQPCDLDPSPEYVWNYRGIPNNGKFKNARLQEAPRFMYQTYEIDSVQNVCGINAGNFLSIRQKEYEKLYNESQPPDSWFGWSLISRPQHGT